MNDLQNPGQLIVVFACSLISIISGMIASILNNIEIYIRIAAACTSLAVGYYAISYYRVSAKKIKLEIKNLQSKP